MSRDINEILEIKQDRSDPASDEVGVVDTAGGSIFSFRGRIGRCRFWATLVPLFVVSMGLNLWFLATAGQGEPTILLFISFAYFVFATWVAMATYAKRWHDLGMSGWMVLTLLIPFVNLLVLLFLGLAPGKPAANRYGTPP